MRIFSSSQVSCDTQCVRKGWINYLKPCEESAYFSRFDKPKALMPELHADQIFSNSF